MVQCVGCLNEIPSWPLSSRSANRQNICDNCSIALGSPKSVDLCGKAILEIIEQPQFSVRFRYAVENRVPGEILGAYSTPINKSYVTIRIHNYRGPVTIIVSCVTRDFR